MYRFPENVLSYSTFSYLKPGEVATCCLVSTKWNTLAGQDRLWANLTKQIFSNELSASNNRIETFVNRISIGQNVRFRFKTGSNQDTPNEVFHSDCLFARI